MARCATHRAARVVGPRRLHRRRLAAVDCQIDMVSKKPRRRWFRPRYSLATLFVLVTVPGIWMGYETNRVWNRHKALMAIHDWTSFDIENTDEDSDSFLQHIRNRYFRDASMKWIAFRHDKVPANVVARVRDAFPEAAIHDIHVDEDNTDARRRIEQSVE